MQRGMCDDELVDGPGREFQCVSDVFVANLVFEVSEARIGFLAPVPQSQLEREHDAVNCVPQARDQFTGNVRFNWIPPQECAALQVDHDGAV